MTDPLWRTVFYSVERAVTPRVEGLVRTSQFSHGTATVVKARARTRTSVARLSSRMWHLVNLPAGTDIARLRNQLGAIDRELRRLNMRLERQQFDVSDDRLQS